MVRSLFDMPQPEETAQTRRMPATSLLHHRSELDLVRAAVELGAETVGGAFTPAERALIRSSLETHAPSRDTLDRFRSEILSGNDPLGSLLCEIRPTRQRRELGAFYTPPALVMPMVSWALNCRPSRLIDAGCGSGRFAAAAAQRCPDLEVIAVDSDPLATILARATLAVLGCTNAAVVQTDYTTMSVPSIRGRTAFVGNPPYVRHHALSRETKAWASGAAKRIGKTISGLAGLHALFYLATALHAEVGDVGCFVTSAEWLDVNYGALIRELLVDGLGGRSIHVLNPRAIPFEEAMTTAAIATFEIGAPVESIRFRSVRSLDAVGDLDEGKPIGRAALSTTKRWGAFQFDPASESQPSNSTTLGSVARVHRGLVTGANNFFVLTRDEARLFGVEEWCRPAITSAREILESGGVIRDGPGRRVLLELPRDLNRQTHPTVDAYLKQGETSRPSGENICDRYIPNHRKPWWYLGPSHRAPLLATYMARQPPVFALNPDGLALLNIGHGIFPNTRLSEEQLASLVSLLNTHRLSFRGDGRTYHGGLEKFEPREMEALQLPLGELGLQ